MGLAVILFAGAIVILAWLFLWSLQRQRLGAVSTPDTAFDNLPFVSANDAVIVASDSGRVVHTNDTIRRWLNTDQLDLEIIARSAHPADTFLELFTREERASFQLGAAGNKRWVEATSRRLSQDASNGAGQMVVVMRELVANGADSNTFDLARTVSIVDEIGETINASLGIEPVLQVLLTIIRREIPADAGEICLWDEATRTLNPRGWTGDINYVLALSEVGGAYAESEGISGWIARYRKPVLVTDVNDAAAVRPKLNSTLYKSYVGVPMLVGDKFIGTLEFASAQSFAQHDLALLQAVSKQVTTSVYNAQLYTEQTRRIEDIATVQQVVNMAEQDPEQVFLTLNQRIAKLLDAEVCGVLLYDELRDALVAQPPYYGLPTQVVRLFAIPVKPGSDAYDIWQRQPYWMSSDLQDEPLAEELQLSLLVNAAGLKDAILMPLQVGNRRIGMMLVGNKRLSSGFSPQDVQNLRLLSAQAAIAVEDVHLSERQQIHETEMTGLQEISQAFGAISHSAEFYADINERIARVMNIALCGVLLYDENKNRLLAQKPFYGLDETLIEQYSVALEPGSAMEDIWRNDDFWFTNNASTDKVIYGAGLAELTAQMGVEKTLLAVMESGGRRLGVVQVANKHGGVDFTDNDARLLLIFAAQVGGMIENARLLREVQDRADESEGLRRVAEFAGAVMTSEDDFLPVLREACRLTNRPSAFINVLDPQTGNLIGSPRYGYGFQRAQPFSYEAYSSGYEATVAISRRALVSNDVRNDPAVLATYKRAAAEIGMVATVMVPLIVGDQTLGEIGVFNRSEPPYSEDDVRNLQAIAIHVAAALDRVRLQEATGQNLRRRLQELDAISRVSNELAVTLDFDHVLDVIRQEATQATDAEGSTIAVMLPATEWLNPEQPRAEKRIGEGKALTLAEIELQALRGGSVPVVIEDYQSYSLKPLPANARSAMAASVVYEDQVVSVIHLYHSQPFHFDVRAATFLETLAAKASLSYGNSLRYIENQERGERLRRRVEQLNQIFELGQMLQSNVDTPTILEAFAFSVQQSIGYDVIMIMMVDETGGVLRRVTQAGLPIDAFEESKKHTLPIATLQKLFQNDEFRMSESFFLPFHSVARWYVDGLESLSTGRAVTRTMHPHSKADWHDGDMLVVPLTGAGGNLLGVMSLDRPFSGQRPDRGTIEILEIFAHQAAATLENTRLYMNSVRLAEQEARLNEVMEAISSTLDMIEIVEAVARGVLQILPFMRMTVALLEPEQLGFDMVNITVKADSSLASERDHRANLNQTALGYSFESGQDFLYGIDGIDQYEDLHAWHAVGERTSLIVPMITGGICLGAMHFGSDLMLAFGFEEFRPLIKRIANLSAVAIQNAHLFEQTRTRTDRLSLLNRVSVALAQSLDTENIMEIALREIASLLRFERARAYIFERETNGARVVVEYPRGDYPPSDIIDMRGNAVFEHVMRTAQPLVIEDISLYSANEAVRQQILSRKFSAYVAIPLTVGGQVSGVLEMDVVNAPRQFDKEKLELSTIIANQAAIAVLNANLLEQTLVRTRELETLLEGAQATSYTLDLDEVYSGVNRLALQALDMDDCAIMLYDNVEEALKVELDLNRQGDRNRITPSGTVYDLRQYAAKSQALRENQIVVIRQSDPNADPKELAEMLENGDTARMLVPLVVREQSIGLLQIELQSQMRTFTHRDLRMAQALGAQAATAIENARLSTQTALLVEQSLVINDISRTISSTMNSDDMIEIVRDQIPGLTDAEEIYVALYDQQTDEIRFPLAMKQGIDISVPPRKLNNDEFSFVIRFRRPVAIGGDNPSAAEVRRNMNIVADVESTRFLGVPLMAGDQVAGVLAVRDIKQTRPFGLNENRILTTIAAQLGATLQNAQLFERVNNFAAELNQRVDERTAELQDERDRMAVLLQSEQEEAEKNSAILEGIADGVLLADASGVVVLFNRAAEQILGLERQTTLGQPLTEIGSHEGAAQWVMALNNWVRSPRRDATAELLLDRLEVGSRVVSVHASPVYNGDQFLGTVSVFRDVTRDVEVDRMKSEFISNVSHELRTPMTSIRGYADLLIGGAAGEISDLQKNFLSTIKGNSDRLADLVNDLLNISRLDSGRDRLRLEAVALDEIIVQVVDNLKGRARFVSKGLTVTTEIDPALPAITADHLKLMEVITNLVDNAFNYTEPGGHIDVTAQLQAQHPDRILIAVSDNGIGIPESFRERIWNRFERYEEHALVMDVAGTGLGLSIVKTLVEMHQGEVWFESEENQGTTFYVSLPIAGPESVVLAGEQTVEG
ncbi:MAG: GAF domain-containing protein [Chloroflexota bacterium]